MHMAPHDPQDGELFVQMISATEITPHNEDPLEDVFGSDSDSPISSHKTDWMPESRTHRTSSASKQNILPLAIVKALR
jgi:hypothetical protein